MRLSKLATIVAIFAAAGGISLAGANVAVGWIENRSQEDVVAALGRNGHDWTSVAANGLQIVLGGIAPDEASRFMALRTASTVVDNARVVDSMQVRAASEIPAPRFSVEILRNGAGISVIGLIPSSVDREGLMTRIQRLSGDGIVTDLMETADYPAPEGWFAAVDYGLTALAQLPRSKISVMGNQVDVTAIAETAQQRRQLETALASAIPADLPVSLQISSPRPVIAPFTLRLVSDSAGARFDACTAQSKDGRQRILSAAAAVGVPPDPACVIGLGAPSPEWTAAAIAGIGAIGELGGGALTMSDVDISLIAPEGTDPAAFDRAVGSLEGALPPVFVLYPVLPATPEIVEDDDGSGPAQFLATRSPEGDIQLRGRVPDDQVRTVIKNFAYARFGIENVTDGTRSDADLPAHWAPRVLTALDTLALLENGLVTVTEDQVSVRGVTQIEEARAEIARMLSNELGDGANFDIQIRYQPPPPEPVEQTPDPEACVGDINTAIAENKISFAPGSDEISGTARETLDQIAKVMEDCVPVPMEIAGYTDSQGRETMNLGLSQARAQAVLTALMARRVLTSNLKATGYGEANPIADNDTEEGREANRRIEFHVIAPEDLATEDAAEDATEDGADGGADGATEDGAASGDQSDDQQSADNAPPAEGTAPDTTPADGDAPADAPADPAAGGN